MVAVLDAVKVGVGVGTHALIFTMAIFDITGGGGSSESIPA